MESMKNNDTCKIQIIKTKNRGTIIENIDFWCDEYMYESIKNNIDQLIKERIKIEKNIKNPTKF